jgi:hypothetical protein
MLFSLDIVEKIMVFFARLGLKKPNQANLGG